MSNKRVYTIPLSDIINKFDVRVKLDEDRVIQFAGFYEAGVELPPIKVIELPDGKYAYVDGRHRAAGRKYLNLTDIDAIILSEVDPAAIYAEALRSNWGGAKPPSRDDIAHTVTRMLELGIAQKTIREHLDFLPKSAVDLYLQWSKGVVSKRKIVGALNAMADGLTIEQAAKTFKIEPERIKDKLDGIKKPWGKNRDLSDQYSIDVRNRISKVYKSASMSTGQLMDNVVKAVGNGDLSAKSATGIVNHWVKYLRRAQVNAEDWLARIDALSIPSDRIATENLKEQYETGRSSDELTQSS